ncbi:hypothetical protein B0A48_16732 [Cryoendolithus antarcticus]|uniref:t-SNARE coiled-coil homology domain-containing protein n=1 Tax=Cryoendolithus antarcticus TaxID=1507870 RepID=A0A1V8SEF0_9PEZI|nr:hypothetical protein B0A48_16732 [Cryoendolithus antarcticus]
MSSISNGVSRKRPASFSSTPETEALDSSSTQATSTRLFKKLKDARASSINTKSGLAQKQHVATKSSASSTITSPVTDDVHSIFKSTLERRADGKENEGPVSGPLIAAGFIPFVNGPLPQRQRIDAVDTLDVSPVAMAASAHVADRAPQISALCENHRVDTLAMMFKMMERFEQKLDTVVDSQRALRTDINRTINRLDTISNSVDLVVESAEDTRLHVMDSHGTSNAIRQQVSNLQANTITTQDRFNVLDRSLSAVVRDVKSLRTLASDINSTTTATRTDVTHVAQEVATVIGTIDQAQNEIDLRISESAESVKGHLLRAERHLIGVPNTCNGIAEGVRTLQRGINDRDTVVDEILKKVNDQAEMVDDIHYDIHYK